MAVGVTLRTRKTQIDTPVALQPCSDDTALLTEGGGVGQINVICGRDGDVAVSHKYVLRMLCLLLLSLKFWGRRWYSS